jgi:hypothetical protein
MQRKTIFLSLAFILPIFVFIFLKFFGKNQFEIPVFHSKKVEMVSGCDYQYVAPYILPDSVLSTIGWKNGPATLIIYSNIVGLEVKRLSEEFEPSMLQVVSITNDDRASKLKNCVFLLPTTSNAVLVDQKKQIRGYYQLTNRDEVDRLMVEVSILLNDY